MKKKIQFGFVLFLVAQSAWAVSLGPLDGANEPKELRPACEFSFRGLGDSVAFDQEEGLSVKRASEEQVISGGQVHLSPDLRRQRKQALLPSPGQIKCYAKDEQGNWFEAKGNSKFAIEVQTAAFEECRASVGNRECKRQGCRTVSVLEF